VQTAKCTLKYEMWKFMHEGVVGGWVGCEMKLVFIYVNKFVLYRFSLIDQ